jgi:membrane dipeptidase
MKTIARKGGVVGIWPLKRRNDTFDTFLRDIDYATKLIGSDHVGVGTDLFGLRDETSIPTHKEFALIPAALLKRGYSEAEVGKIIGGNFMRVFRQVTADR